MCTINYQRICNRLKSFDFPTVDFNKLFFDGLTNHMQSFTQLLLNGVRFVLYKNLTSCTKKVPVFKSSKNN